MVSRTDRAKLECAFSIIDTSRRDFFIDLEYWELVIIRFFFRKKQHAKKNITQNLIPSTYSFFYFYFFQCLFYVKKTSFALELRMVQNGTGGIRLKKLRSLEK